jgi:hypothetical protein
MLRAPKPNDVLCSASDLGVGIRSNTSRRRVQQCTHIDLSRKWIGVERALKLSQELAADSASLRVESFTAAWASLGLNGTGALLQALVRAPRLRQLDLSGNWIGNTGAKLILRFLRSSRSLRRLRLRWNSFTESAGGTLRAALQSKCGRRLVELDVGGNWLRNTGVLRFASCLPTHPTLRVLRMDLNSMQSAGMRGLVRALRNNTLLQVLDLAGNTIGDRGVLDLAKLLGDRRAAPLESVNLQLNHLISDAGASYIADVLASSRIQQLDLGGNKIGNYGAARLLSAASSSSTLAELWLDDNVGARCRTGNRSFGSCRTGDKGRTKSASFNSTIMELQAAWISRSRRLRASKRHSIWWWRAPLRANVMHWRGSGRGQIRRSSDSSDEGSEKMAYYQRVYPLLGTRVAKQMSRRPKRPLVFYTTAPKSMLPVGCEGHSWRHCRLDNYFANGQSPPKIRQGSYFAPFRLPPGMCMRSEFSWDTSTRAAWEASYVHAAGMEDFSWAEVSHTREQMGGAWLYLTPGSGIFWNCGRSLRARNKAAAALRLAEEATQLKSRPRFKMSGTAAQTIASMIEADSEAVCFGAARCRTFMRIFHSNRTDRNDNCYGQCSPERAPLSTWLERAAKNSGAREWRLDHMSASSVLDKFITYWAMRLKYDSLQLTMQPQVWCGLGWTTEILDLHVREHRVLDIQPRLSLRNPVDETAESEPCIVRRDNASRRAFHLVMYCEGTAMEQTARCMHDVSQDQKGFTVYSQYPRHRYDACLAGA